MAEKTLSSVEPNTNEEMTLLLKSKETRHAKNGNPYVVATVCDSEKTQTDAKIWGMDSDEFMVEPGTCFRAVVFAKMFNGEKQFEIVRYDNAPNGTDPMDYVPSAPYPGIKIYNAILTGLRRRIPKKGDAPDLVDLTKAVYEANKEALLVCPAAERMHHAELAGLLDHTYGMIQMAAATADIFDVDKELLLSGTALHDIGKVVELDFDRFGSVEKYSFLGCVTNHVEIGISMVREEATKADYDPERVNLLINMIAAHPGKPEWRAIAEPITTEAMILHHFDMMSANAFKFAKAEEGLEPGTMSDRIRELGHVVYKPTFRK